MRIRRSMLALVLLTLSILGALAVGGAASGETGDGTDMTHNSTDMTHN